MPNRLQNNKLRAKSTKKHLPLVEGSKSQLKKLGTEERNRRLRAFIELANSIPPSQEASDFGAFIRNDDEIRSIEERYSFWIKKFKHLLVYLEDFPSDFRRYVLEDSLESLTQINMNNLADDKNVSHLSKIYSALFRYDEFREVREKLRTLVRLGQGPGKHSYWAFIAFNRIDVSASLSIRDNGTIEISFDSFAETINGIDVSRIRQCKDCQRIFWAKRKDQSCCSRDCANRYHVRQHREKYASDPIAHKLRLLDREGKSNTKKRR